VQKSGEYRFDVAPDGDVTLVTVRKGEGDATGDGPAVRLRSHQRARFTSGTSLAHEVYEAPSPDGFDDWCHVRNQREDHAISARYVSPDVIGYEDLDEYGSWRTVPSYGAIWVPTVVSAGWAPYRYGHWVWISPWGWTWVDDASWGFAPFHYGRWVYTGGYWGWAPGPIYVRPVYAPALVAWFGGGFGITVGFGSGYGWCPLGYGEPFIPWYAGSRGYFRNVNVSNTRITNITNVTNNYYNYGNGDNGRKRVKAFDYANAKAPGGVTAVEGRTIVNSQPVAKAVIPIQEKNFRNLNSSQLEGRMALEPTRESRLGINAEKPAAIPPTRTMERPVVSRVAAPAAVRMENNRPEAAPDRTMGHPTSERVAVTDSTPRLPARVIPRPSQQGEGQRGEPAARTENGAPKVASPGVSSPAAREVRAAEPGVGRMVPRPPAINRTAEETPIPASPRATREEAPQAEDRPMRSTSPAMRQVPRPPTEAVSQPAVEQHAAPSAPANTVPRPSGPVAVPRESPRGDSDHSPRYTAPPSSPSPAPQRPVMEAPRQSPPSASPAPAPRQMEAPRQSAPPSNPAPSTPHASPAPAQRTSPPAQNTPGGSPRNNWRN